MVSRRLSRPWSLRPRRRRSASSCKGAITSVAEKTGKVFLTSGIEHLSISSRSLHRKQIGIRLHKPTFLWISGARERERARERQHGSADEDVGWTDSLFSLLSQEILCPHHHHHHHQRDYPQGVETVWMLTAPTMAYTEIMALMRCACTI